jgi:hypothetical protein
MSKVKKLTKKDNFTEIRNILAREGYAEYAAVMDHELDLLAKKNASGTGKMTATQVANEGIKSAILECMANEPNRMFTISEMIKCFECCADLSLPKVTALVGQLVTAGSVKRTEEKRKAYFSYIG